MENTKFENDIIYKLPKVITDNDNLCYIDAKVYMYLYYKHYYRPENSKGFKASNKEIAEEFKVNIRTVEKSFNRLRKEKVIETYERRTKTKKNSRNTTDRRIKFLVEPK